MAEEKMIDSLPALEKFLTEKIEGIEQRTKLQFEARDKAIIKADHAMEKRFDALNGSRQILLDQAAGFLTRNEYDIHHSALSDRVTSVEKAITATEAANKGMGHMISIIVSAVAFFASISSIIYVFLVFSKTVQH
jgi:hypothetical protein